MIKKIIKAMYFSFISITLVAILLAGWTGYTLISQSSKSSEIINVIQDMYFRQKSFVIDVIDLSKLLIKDKSENISSLNNNLSVEDEFPTDTDEKPQLSESPITKDNGDNPLGIVIEPSLPEVNEKKLPELNEEPLVNERNESFLQDMDMDMDL